MCSTKEGLDAPHEWAMHAWWQTPNWETPVILLPPWASYNALLVQGNGGDYPRAWSVARGWTACTMWEFPLPSQMGGLLLQATSIYAAWLLGSKTPFTRVHWAPSSFIWLLPQIPLRAQLYLAILGSCKAMLSGGRASSNNWRDGKEGYCMSWWCAPASDPAVSPFYKTIGIPFEFLIWLDMQIDQHILFQHMGRVLAVHKQVGQIGNIIVIIYYHQRW